MQLENAAWLLVAAMLLTEPTSGAAAEPATPESKEQTPDNSGNKPEPESRTEEAASLHSLLERAIEQSPGLKARLSAISSAKGEVDQSTAWSNPELSIDAENLGGSGDYKGVSSSELTFGVSQQIQLGGKISARENIAKRGLEISKLDHLSAGLDLVRDVSIAYAELVAAKEIEFLASEQKQLANDVLQSVSKRVDAAAAPLVQRSRAEVELFSAEITLEGARRRLDSARKDLGGLLGQENFSEAVTTTEFYSLTVTDDNNFSPLTSAPEIERLGESLEHAKAELDLERANSIPDVSVNLGVREIRESGDRAFVVGASIPAPVFDANRGNIEAARHRVAQLESENRAFLTTQKISFAKAKAEMLDAFRRAETLRTKILPAAEEAFRLSRQGYELGKFPYLEVLDAQRSLFGVKQQFIEAVKDFQSAKARAERLSATSINLIGKGETNAE